MSVHLDSHGVETTVVLGDEAIQGEYLATLKSVSPYSSNDGGSRYSLRTYDLAGATKLLVVGADGID